jgi:predicted nuclease of predicted toxin-antitoxin system
MRFLLDQNIRARLLPHLRALGHDATRIGSDHPGGLSDLEVLSLARKEGRILLTQDSDYANLVIRGRHRHTGIVLFQIGNADLATWIARLETVLREHAHDLARGRFLVVTADTVQQRTRRGQP